MAGGGVMNLSDAYRGVSTGIGTMATLGAGIVDAVDTPNDLGYQSRAGTIGKSALSGAAAGSMLGPWGAAAGTVLGGIKGIISANKMKGEEDTLRSRMRNATAVNDANYSSAMIAGDPTLVQGNRGAQYFGNGGSIRIRKIGGRLRPMQINYRYAK